MNLSHPLATKIHLYRALYRLNRGFDITLTWLKRLSELGMDRVDLSEHEINVELARAELNDELTGLLQSYEQEDEYYWSDRKSDIDKQSIDPDDVFFKARDRKQEIKQQIKMLQSGLARQHPKRRRTKTRKAS